MHHEVERLIDLYDGGGLSRRQLLQGLLALSIGPHSPTLSRVPFRARQQHRYFTLVR